MKRAFDYDWIDEEMQAWFREEMTEEEAHDMIMEIADRLATGHDRVRPGTGAVTEGSDRLPTGTGAVTESGERVRAEVG